MNLNLVNSVFNDAKFNRFAQNFINELEKSINSERMFYKKMENKMTTRFRDKFYIERNNILNNYAEENSNGKQMYYIYSENSKNENIFNLCICDDEKSNIVIEKDRSELPYRATVGSILREGRKGLYLDDEATRNIENQIQELKERLFEEQEDYLESKRIEGHIYELYEKDEDRVWLFDLTEDNNEGIEEINFPIELIEQSEEGDIFEYQDGKYNKK